jgi:tetratricopeptide (TPR) repeat protein
MMSRARQAAGAAFLAAVLGGAHAQVPDALEVARRLGQAGAVDLALEHVEQRQPKDAAAASWIGWETLRLQLLARRGRHADVLARVRSHPDSLQARPALVALLAARSSLRLGQPAAARRLLAQAFLQPDLAPGDYRDARLAVIESYLAERNGEAAYRSMLRFRQDFAPVRTDEAEHFVTGLIAAGRVDEAAGWLASLEPDSPSAALLRLRAGLIKPQTALSQARALVAKTPSESAWGLLAEAGRALNDPAIAVEVLEGRLNASDFDEGLAAPRDRTAALWKAYSEAGQRAANEAQLLSGDDPAWVKRAGVLQSSRPQLARALLGSLILQGRSPGTRTEAGLQLLASLRTAKLGRAALHLFADRQQFPLAEMDPVLKLQLGNVAAESRQGAMAVGYWQGLTPPADATAQEWQVRRAEALFQAGMTSQAIDMARTLLETQPAPVPAPSAELLRRLMAIAAEALEIGQTRPAKELFASLLPLTNGPDRAVVLRSLGKAHESSGEFRAAAGAYLQGASLAAAPESDRDALQAREAAANALAKAGMLADARAVYEWLARNASDRVMRDRAVRALGNL